MTARVTLSISCSPDLAASITCSTNIVQRSIRGWSLCCNIRLAQPAVHDEVGCGDEAALIACQEEDSACLLNCFSEAAAGEMDLSSVPLLQIVAEPVLEERGVEWAWTEGIESDAFSGVNDR